MSQVATSVSRQESQGKLPSQTVVNPKQNAIAISLRSRKVLQNDRLEKRVRQSTKIELQVKEANQYQQKEKNTSKDK